MSNVSVGVLGSAGRMGQEVIKAVSQAPDLTLVAELDVGDDLKALAAAGAQVVVDFTNPDAVMANIESCLAQGISCVVGTSGLTPGCHLARVSIRCWCYCRPEFWDRSCADDAVRSQGRTLLRFGRDH